MNATRFEPLVIHGWTVFAHPLFLAQIEMLAGQVEILKRKDPAGYAKKNASKQLAAINRLAFDVIPQDPGRPEYRQGGARGDDHKHWFQLDIHHVMREGDSEQLVPFTLKSTRKWGGAELPGTLVSISPQAIEAP